MNATLPELRPGSRATAAAPAGGVAHCRHCQSVFAPTPAQPEFCCAGCEYVHRLITGQKLDRFYELRRGPATPVRPLVFQPRDYRWLTGLVQQAERAATERGAGGLATLELGVQGIVCVGCVWLIERLWRDRPGAHALRVNPSLGRLTLQWTPGGGGGVTAFAQELQRFGYLTGPAAATERSESAALLVRLGLCAAFALNGMLFALPGYLGMTADFPFARLFVALAFLFAAASVAVGGTYFFGRSWQSLRRGVLHIDLPISLGIIFGFAGSVHAWAVGAPGFAYFDFVSTFTFLMLVGRWTQLAAVERNRHRLLASADALPDVTWFAEGTAEEAGRAVATKPVRALVRGDRFGVEPGAIVPVSGTLAGRGGEIGMDWINGESEARVAAPGQIVASGAINLSSHPLHVTALEAWSDSLLARLLAPPASESPRDRALERVIRAYLVAVLIAAAVGGTAWWLGRGDVTQALHVTVAILVVSCPCALGVTLPLVDELALAHLRRGGVFVRGDSLWARLRRVRNVVFDKTGTLTLESLALREPAALGRLPSEARAALWTLVGLARHPAAACVREAMLAGGWNPSGGTGGTVDEEVGWGLQTTDAAGRRWRLGRREWAAPAAPSAADLHLGCDGEPVAAFETTEQVRADAADEIAALRDRGLEVFILSGDRAPKVAAMADRLGLPCDHALAGMSPQAKADWVRRTDRGDTMMIGDGANDSLAFDAATCRGTPAIERGVLTGRADFHFLGHGLAGVRHLLAVAVRRRATIVVVLGFAILYNVGAVTVALAGAMNPLLAAILMPASALVSMALALGGMQLRSGGRRERRSFPVAAGVPRSAHFPKPVRNDGAPCATGPGGSNGT